MTYKVTQYLKHNGRDYVPGESIDLDDNTAEELMIDGAVAPFEGKVPEAGTPPEGTGKAPETIEETLAAMKKVELVEKAKELELELTGGETKAELIQMIVAKTEEAKGEDL